MEKPEPKPYVHQDYPKFKFRPNPSKKSGYDSVLIKTEADSKKLGKEWKESPADFETPIVTAPGDESHAAEHDISHFLAKDKEQK